MAILNNWQKISRVIPGNPWGDGATGSATVSADPNTRATITGTATQTTGTAGSTAFANGDLVILHQTQGTGAGQWEVNRVASGGGSTSLTFQVALNYTYGTGAQIIKVPRYTSATVSAHSVTAWNGSTGGVEVIVAKTSVNVSGALSATSLGFRGGIAGSDAAPSQGYNGEGTVGASSATTSANGPSSGGSAIAGGGNFDSIDGPGGSHATSGAQGTAAGGIAGTVGSTVGSTDLTTMFFGGAGGAAARGGSGGGDRTIGAGGNSGGIIMIISQSVTLSAGVTVNGGTPTNTTWTGGNGAGGSLLIVCGNGTLGTNNGTAIAGANANGGSGGVGRIAVHHSGTITGTTNPTFTDVSDATLVELSPSGFFNFF